MPNGGDVRPAVLNAVNVAIGNLSFLPTLSIIISGLTIIYISGVVIYRLYFHPLASYPGPFFARISPIPITISLLRGRIPFFVKAAHDKYGSVVRVSPNELAFDNESAWKDIYGSRPGHKNFHKDPIHVGSIQSLPGVSTITMANDADHARQRRALSHAFSTKALLEQEYIVKSYIDVFSKKMNEFADKGETVDVVDWFAYTTFDIIGDMALGEPFGCLTSEDFRFWVPMISNSIAAGAVEQATRRLATTDGALQKFLLWCIPKWISETRKHHLEYSREKILKYSPEIEILAPLIASRRMAQTNSEHKDLIYYLLKQQETGSLNLNEVIVNGALFIIAGTETTAGFLSGLCNQLLLPHNRFILERLTAEIRSAFNSDADIRFEELVKLPYLTAVIEEGLRIFPSAPIGFVRTVPEGGDTVSGHCVPGGTTVSVGMWAATHSERNFKDPYVFRPERWMDKENSEDKLGASNPFSLGPRGCIGRNLSYMEMRLIIGKLLWHNDVHSAGGNERWNPEGEYKNMIVYNNWMKPPLYVKLTPRTD